MQLYNSEVKSEVFAREVYGTPKTIPLVAKMQGGFDKGYKSELKSIISNEKFNTLNISRDGIYDTLPEGLFHQPYKLKHFKSTEDMVEEIKYQRKKEQEARTFFLPFEQELYRLRVQLEKQERAFFENDLHEHLSQFREFWGINPNVELTNTQLQNLLSLLPYAYRIAGNRGLAAWAFSLVLEDTVTITNTSPEEIFADNWLAPTLGEMQLGEDAVLGNSFYDGMPGYQIKVGPIPVEAIPAYLPGGKKEKIVNLLQGYFLPVEVDTTFVIEPKEEEHSFKVQEEKSENYLGVNTYL